MPGFISVEDAKALLDQGALVVDVRTPREWEEGHGAGSILLPLQELAARVHELPKDRVLLMVCRSGARSQTATEYLLERGFREVHNLGPWQRNPSHQD